GSSVALTSSTVLVGAPFAAVAGHNNAGAVYEVPLGAGTPTRTLKKSPSAAHDLFGVALPGSGGAVFVGRPFDDGIALDAGAVYAFAAGQVTPHLLSVPTLSSKDAFGAAVATVGTQVVIGAPANAGTVYVLDGDPSSQTFGVLRQAIPNPATGG